jgi:hypothetical protein
MPKSQAEIDAERAEHWANSPFQRVRATGNDQMENIGFRVAAALEYIAAQLGQINARERDKAGGPQA